MPGPSEGSHAHSVAFPWPLLSGCRFGRNSGEAGTAGTQRCRPGRGPCGHSTTGRCASHRQDCFAPVGICVLPGLCRPRSVPAASRTQGPGAARAGCWPHSRAQGDSSHPVKFSVCCRFCVRAGDSRVVRASFAESVTVVTGCLTLFHVPFRVYCGSAVGFLLRSVAVAETRNRPSEVTPPSLPDADPVGHHALPACAPLAPRVGTRCP